MKKQTISADFYFQNLTHIPIIDVRSPGEFAKGHIPNVQNIELFTDGERAVVGTAYKQESKEKAIEIGFEYVKPKLDDFIEKSIAIAPNKTVVVHCWRGGMRSNAFADHLVENGFEKVYVIEKGYKAFRNYVLQFFEQNFNLKVLGGYTGSGKTEILHSLQKKHQQVIDLEALANHRGSAFGGIDLPPQPTTEQFENNLFNKLRRLDANLPIWVEDESISIGKISIPTGFFAKMRDLPVYFLAIPFEERTKHLVHTYATLSHNQLADAISRITKRLGYDKAKFALEALDKKDYYKVVELTLLYYDNCYLKGLQKREATSILKFEIAEVNADKNAEFLIHLTN
ncbi:tRNA 2-selenouridine(34) synthase MnmH [Pedobacter changchengzhani]|uniref:tRNA 2-selenouridine(34) synthase MnmH n=1 Tax=Pedobacter changchengzhani TaxID=2529274 RepID=A0A4R5MJ82_9SPHI|nr:tRNA 2-selenouridine(34) synthase MnmH [Pedobacter changchengzhani]TDG35235.1 tRNA 2-selenouridine(34) synthase MnmH [Pedobacter changchengzhani]